MCKFSEKTKRMIRFFASAEGPKTIDDLVIALGYESRNDKIGNRQIRHTVGDLVYEGVLRSWKPPHRNFKRYKLTNYGKQVAATFHVPLPTNITRSFDNAQELNTENSKIIPKENEVVAPPTPIANDRSKTVRMGSPQIATIVPQITDDKKTVLGISETFEEAVDKFDKLYDTDPDRAIKALARQVIKTREELRTLKETLRSI